MRSQGNTQVNENKAVRSKVNSQSQLVGRDGELIYQDGEVMEGNINCLPYCVIELRG